MFETIKSFFGQCVRVWHLLRKPSSTEFKTIAKVSALGLGLIGLIGFIVSVFVSFFK
jgi:protein transport protein SEC61 subunit gamma and related proteins